MAFCKKIEYVAWNNIREQYIGTGTFNVLDPLNSSLSKSVREKDPRYDEERGLLIQYVEFEKIGGFATTIDIDEKIPASQHIRIVVPTSKLKQIKKLLENKGCKIIN